MKKTDMAIKALREAAEAYRELPDVFKSRSYLGGGSFINPDALDTEADRIQARIIAFEKALEEE